MSNKLDIIFLQETLVFRIDVEHILQGLYKGWSFFVIDARGRLGGVAIGINCRTVKLINIWGYHSIFAIDIFF